MPRGERKLRALPPRQPRLDMHWFFFCCGALVNVPSSMDMVKSFANEYIVITFQSTLTQNSRFKPANLFAFDAHSFHPIYAVTFLLDFFQHIIIKGRNFDSAIRLLANNSSLSHHTGIKRFWARDKDKVVKHCTLKWAHSRARPWGMPVPYQCSSCHCIQAWDQKGHRAPSELARDASMCCSYKGKQGRCCNRLTFVFVFFLNFTCIPGHVTKTKTGRYMGIGHSVRTPGAAPPKPAFVVLPHWYIT